MTVVTYNRQLLWTQLSSEEHRKEELNRIFSLRFIFTLIEQLGTNLHRHTLSCDINNGCPVHTQPLNPSFGLCFSALRAGLLVDRTVNPGTHVHACNNNNNILLFVSAAGCSSLEGQLSHSDVWVWFSVIQRSRPPILRQPTEGLAPPLQVTQLTQLLDCIRQAVCVVLFVVSLLLRWGGGGASWEAGGRPFPFLVRKRLCSLRRPGPERGSGRVCLMVSLHYCYQPFSLLLAMAH